jgi:DNA-binding XRE family transcriptional regulator
MLALAVEEEIKQLLREATLSQRAIALKVGVSRGTVNAIACGRRPDYDEKHRLRAGNLISTKSLPRRCPMCGALVYMPCLACRVRAWKEGGRRNDQ